MEHTTFTKKYLIVNEVFNAITHGIGTGLSIAGLVLLIIKGAQMGSPIRVVSYTIFGASMILLFLFSTLFHSLIFTKARKVFQVFDHSSIYLLIAGSYTPYCLVTIQGWLGWTLFAIIWTIAIAGIVFKSIWLNKRGKTDVVLYIIMGWLCLIAIKPLYIGLGSTGFLLLFLGGVSYTIGAAFYSLKNVKFMHVVWHLFVLLGAIFIFFSVYLYT
ncbi:PAQR family membrane homeostasis protein TrhA [Vagococcus carniphilus]|uniref:PAQR family membrane homeostasis protein TrhA n=1 Tax=Vagococcus carniphilus TaxID=218144 RepID=UPI0028903448|nr:hemolysin III family protein [Vagococcus carniphilus]MDT2815058.1 hemolysin III family protein [Vagococcus carniphilus]MDT2829667.1 hemolysin III family protein [Vagococcus carniphilus]MDT2839126.1 hemolysin III family protein [Vagococcus carniphilus]MDT2853184.1 hemolysin III family protein [Vagococcus carniphilus]MDT2865043.1 hemolysin III family protein [Vagococcus carniphilus]